MDVEVWKLLLGIGAFLTPIVLAAMARDRSLIAMIKSSTDPIHERINRVRDEYVREDHLNSHLTRIDKRFDDMVGEMRRNAERVDKGFEDMRRLFQQDRRNELG